jgi:DNA-binding transcriptional ArsR family regulator
MSIENLQHNFDAATAILKALSNNKRLMIVCALHGGEKNVGELEKIVGLSQSALSQHLARLRRDDVVHTRRDAQTIFYSLSDPATVDLLNCLQKIFQQKQSSN